MKNIRRLGSGASAAAWLMLLLAPGGRALSDAPKPTPNPLTERETVLPSAVAGILVRHDLRPVRGDRVTFWTPGAEDLRQLQAGYKSIVPVVGLPDPARGLPRTDVTDYYRQYVGVVVNGKRLVLINGLSPRVMADAAGRNDWHTHAVFTFDGGRNFFYALYDSQARQVVRFVFNGH